MTIFVRNSFSYIVNQYLVYDLSALPGNPPFDVDYPPCSISVIIYLFRLLNHFKTDRQFIDSNMYIGGGMFRSDKTRVGVPKSALRLSSFRI